MSGHLFIINGDLTKLACDAILIPTDEVFRIENPWVEVLGGWKRPTSWGDSTVIALDPVPGEPQIWLGNIGQIGDESDFAVFEPVLTEFVEKAAGALQAVASEDRIYAAPKLRLAVNVIGSGRGGASRKKGELVHGLVLALERVARAHDVDIILVAFGEKPYAAAQRARRQIVSARPLSETWQFDSGANPHLESCARRIADAAIDSKLVLFIGAGVSVGAGLPAWGDLLRAVAIAGGIEPDIVNLLEDKDFRDQAALLERWLGCGDDGLKRRVADELGHASRYSVQHGLLASLPSKEAVTTNFDRLYEEAANTGGRALAILPESPSAADGRWLLKLHGSIDATDRLILTRSDFLSMPRQYGALLGLVQGLLLMRHMLFVGYSLHDEDFHELMYEVRAARGEAGRGSSNATVLTLGDDGLDRQLWEDDLSIVPIIARPAKEVSKPVAARQLEIFLDLVGYLATTSAAFFLDSTYRKLSEDERPLRDSLTELAKSTRNDPPGSVGYIVSRFLRQLGDGAT